MELLSTLRSKNVIRGCSLSKQQLPKLKCLEKSSLPTNCNKEINPEARCKRKSEQVLEIRERKKLKMDGTGASKTDMGLVSTFPNTNVVTSMKPRINHLVKKPANGTTCKLSEVNCVKKVPSTDGVGCKFDTGGLGDNKMKSTLRPKNVIRACPLLSKQLPKVKCLEKSSVPNNCNKKLNPVAGCKRKSEELSESRERKKLKLKMDGATTLICYNILTEIMDLVEQSGKLHTRVEKPARRWGLDDCSDIVKKAEDLGTTKRKLEQDKYLFAEQFEADVRRTLSTAILCNPRDKHYHESAKILLETFDRLWKPVTMRKGWKELLKPSVVPPKIEPTLFYSAEKARLEAKGEALKLTARLQSEYELKKQREAERKASRIALDMMEKSAVIDDNWKVFKDLEALMGQPMVRSQMKNNKLIKSPLEELGLYIKEEYNLGTENDYCISTNEENYLEEGEIIW